MTKEAEDRGDQLHSDESGDTDDLEAKGKVIEGESERVEDVKDEPKKDPPIPKSRFDEAVGKARREMESAARRAESAETKARELEERLAASQGQIDAKKVVEEVDELEDKLDQAKADGNKELAKSIRDQIREKQQSLADARAEVRAAHATAVAIEQIRYDAAVEKMETEHTELNPDHDDYDQSVVDELLEYKEAFEAKGLSSSDSLRKAIRAVYRDGKKETPAKDEAADKAAEAGDAKKEAAVAKALAARKDQPANTAKKGANSDAAGKSGTPKDITKISDKEFDKLDDDDLKRMRGDDL